MQAHHCKSCAGSGSGSGSASRCGGRLPQGAYLGAMPLSLATASSQLTRAPTAGAWPPGCASVSVRAWAPFGRHALEGRFPSAVHARGGRASRGASQARRWTALTPRWSTGSTGRYSGGRSPAGSSSRRGDMAAGCASARVCSTTPKRPRPALRLALVGHWVPAPGS